MGSAMRRLFTSLILVAVVAVLVLLFSANYMPGFKVPYRHVLQMSQVVREVASVKTRGNHSSIGGNYSDTTRKILANKNHSEETNLIHGIASSGVLKAAVESHGPDCGAGRPSCSCASIEQYEAISLCTGKSLTLHPSGFNKTNSTLLLLFTTVHDLAEKRYIHLNSIKIWSLLSPQVYSVLFLTLPLVDSQLPEMACNAGWEVLPTPRCNVWGLPVLKDMFAVVMKYFNNHKFYGYANGDLLFDTSLVETFTFLKTYHEINTPHIMVGRRTDVKMQVNQTVRNILEVNSLAQTGKLAWLNAIDYFITPRSAFPWGSIKDVVVGRRSYDNYLLWWAWSRGIPVIDITQTCLVVHQSGQHGYYASHSAPGGEYNVKLIGEYDYYRGTTSCAPLITLRGQEGRLHLARRLTNVFCGKNNWRDGKQEKLKVLM